MMNREDPATPRQTFALFCITGFDVRGAGLTKGDAHDLLSIADTDKDYVLKHVASLPGAIYNHTKAAPTPEPKVSFSKRSTQAAVAEAVEELAQNERQEREVRKREERIDRPRKRERKPRRVRPRWNDKSDHSSMEITIPAPIAAMLDTDQLYECYLTPDGILYRPVDS